MSEAEWQTRLDLAACYRLVDLFGWSDLINTRITARVPGQDNHFLINPHGLLFDEITASSLVKIDAEGNKVEPSEAEINSGGFAMPSTVHMARSEVACVLHTHSIAGCAVSMQRSGLLPLNQHALQIIGDVANPRLLLVGRVNPVELAQQSRPFELGWFITAAGGRTIGGGDDFVRDRVKFSARLLECELHRAGPLHAMVATKAAAMLVPTISKP
jgi:hypothetical protein